MCGEAASRECRISLQTPPLFGYDDGGGSGCAHGGAIVATVVVVVVVARVGNGDGDGHLEQQRAGDGREGEVLDRNAVQLCERLEVLLLLRVEVADTLPIVLDALSGNPQPAATRCAGRDLQLDGTLEQRNPDDRAETGLCQTDRNVDDQIESVTSTQPVRPSLQEIPRTWMSVNSGRGTSRNSSPA